MDRPASPQRPTLREVASLADVSEPTVSRVLNGRAGVAQATRTRVVAALAELGFTDVPEPGRTRRGAVGIVSPELTNPVFARLVHEIASHLANHGTVATVGVAAQGLATEERYLSEFVGTGVDGLILIGGRHAEHPVDTGHYRRLIDDALPLVLVNGAPVSLPVPQVRCDEARAAERAADHLVALGHRRIGCLLGPARYHTTTRFIAGFEEAARRHGLEGGPDAVVESFFTREGGRAGAARLLDRGMTAMICGNDLMALGAVTAARSRGLSVPGDLSVVGYDGTDFTATTDPPLTTMRQPFARMGKLIAEAMAAEVEGSDRYRDSYVFTPELVARDSTGPVSTGRPR